MAKKKKNTGKKSSVKRKRKSKKRSLVSSLLPFAIAAFFILVAVLAVNYREELFPPVVPHKKISKRIERRGGSKKKDLRKVTLYFSDNKGLNLVGRRFSIEEDSIKREIESVIKDLITGVRGLDTKTIPSGTKLLNVEIKGAIAYVDFSREIVANHPGGSLAELQTIFSVVNSIVLNFREIKGVQILVEGRRRDTLAGHIDISLPLKGDRKLIRG